MVTLSHQWYKKFLIRYEKWQCCKDVINLYYTYTRGIVLQCPWHTIILYDTNTTIVTDSYNSCLTVHSVHSPPDPLCLYITTTLVHLSFPSREYASVVCMHTGFLMVNSKLCLVFFIYFCVEEPTGIYIHVSLCVSLHWQSKCHNK